MRIALLLSAFFIAVPMSPSQAQGDGDAAICGNIQSAPAEGVAACTRLLRQGRLTPDTRAVVFANRALWYSRVNQHGPALRDANQAIALQPQLADHYFTRGAVYERLGQRAAAIRDYNRALTSENANVVENARLRLARLAGGTEAAPDPPATPSITFRIWRRGSDTLHLRFFSRERNHIWPGVGKHWPLTTNDVQSFRLNCQPNETICYGAWIPEDDDDDDITYWGAGKDGDKACRNCCYRCLNQTTNVISLNPSR